MAVSDLVGAAALFEERHGLRAQHGGRHPGWGTANRVVPLGDSYLELVAIADEREASTSTFGQWVGSLATLAGRPFGWAVRPADLDAIASRLGLAPQPGERARPDGSVLRWRTAGVEAAAAMPGLPFFIEWAPGTPFPGRPPTDDPTPTVELLEIETESPDRLSEWLGEHTLPIRVCGGTGGVVRVVLRDGADEIVLES